MCLIIHKPEGKRIDHEYALDAEMSNPDGFGIVYLDTGQVIKQLDYSREDMWAKHLDTDRPLVCHWRFATVGKVTKRNIHPFHFGGGNYLFSNGTVASLGTKKKSDTAVVAGYLNSLPREHWAKLLRMSDVRFAVVDSDRNVHRFGQWHEEDGCYYSNNNHFEPWTYRYRGHGYGGYVSSMPSKQDGWPKHSVKLLAVYGTLKFGECNHRFLEGAIWHGEGFTKNGYLMTGSHVPRVYEAAKSGLKGYPIPIELWEVTDPDTQDGLDALEGHPYNYRRRIVPVEVGGKTCYVWMYVVDGEIPDGSELIESFPPVI